jgi:hypothetical protein
MFVGLDSLLGYIITYHIININDDARIETLSHIGISVCRVTKLSKKAATINIGTRPMAIFMPCLAPRFNDSMREKVFGKSIELPKTNPAAPAITMDDISSVPCIHITNTDAIPRFLLKKKYWKDPSIIPFLNKANTVPTEANTPLTNVTSAT